MTCIPGTSMIQPYAPGNGWTPGFGQGSPSVAAASTPAPYVASAVHFDGSTWLINPSLNAADSGHFSFSLWAKVTAPTSGVYPTFWVVDPAHLYWNAFYAQGPGPSAGAVDFFFGDDMRQYASNSGNTGHGQWHHFLGTADVDHPQGFKVRKLYVDGVDYGVAMDDSYPSGTGVLQNLPFFIGYDGYTSGIFTGDMSDIWIAPGVSLLDSNGNVPTATMRKFISSSGKPVDIGSNCSTPTGSTPAICLLGNSSTFGTNKGTGGAFVTTGTFTNAATSPSN